MPRKRKSRAEVSVARREAALSRWSKLDSEQRSAQNAVSVRLAIAASPRTKKGKR